MKRGGGPERAVTHYRDRNVVRMGMSKLTVEVTYMALSRTHVVLRREGARCLLTNYNSYLSSRSALQCRRCHETRAARAYASDRMGGPLPSARLPSHGCLPPVRTVYCIGLYVPTVLGESPGGNTVHTGAKLGFFVRRSAFMNHDDMNTTYTRLISIPTYTLRRNPYSTSSTFCIGADGRSSFGRRERGPGPPKRGARIMAACTHID